MPVRTGVGYCVVRSAYSVLRSACCVSPTSDFGPRTSDFGLPTSDISKQHRPAVERVRDRGQFEIDADRLVDGDEPTLFPSRGEKLMDVHYPDSMLLLIFEFR